MKKSKIKTKLGAIGTTLFLTAMQGQTVFGTEGGIGTAEVKTATENIQRVITSIAMPLGRSSYFCKCSYCSG